MELWLKQTDAEGQNACLVLKYPQGTGALNLKYGISFVDEAQARKNMEREVAGKTVAELQSTGRDIWNEALGKIKIEGGTVDEKTVFYTSLYRCFERPVCISEDGRYYSPFDGTVMKILVVRFILTIGFGIHTGHTTPCGYCLIQNKKKISCILLC